MTEYTFKRLSTVQAERDLVAAIWRDARREQPDQAKAMFEARKSQRAHMKKILTERLYPDG
jgi:hypothetical protein